MDLLRLLVLTAIIFGAIKGAGVIADVAGHEYRAKKYSDAIKHTMIAIAVLMAAMSVALLALRTLLEAL